MSRAFVLSLGLLLYHHAVSCTAFITPPLITPLHYCHNSRVRMAAALLPKTPLEKIRSAAANHSLSTGSLLETMETSLFAPFSSVMGDHDGRAGGVDMGRAEITSLLERWELEFINHKKLGFPFYNPLRNMVTLEEGEGRIIRARINVAENLQVPLATFTVIDVIPSDSPGSLYSLVVEGDKRYQVVVSKEKEGVVMAVRSEDGEVIWLLRSVETYMKKIEANKRRYAREIMELAAYDNQPKVQRDNFAGYKAVREVWRRIFERFDEKTGLKLARSVDLVNLAPFFPLLLLATLVISRGDPLQHFQGINALFRSL